jgi:hypothetical protein
MTFGEPAATDLGVQKTIIFVTFFVTARLYVPADWKFLASPP